MNVAKLFWETGTAYDFFISLQVLHDPKHYGLRPSWAAGVRSRLAVNDREILEQAQEIIAWPVKWIHALPAPKDGAAVLWTLSQIRPPERLFTLIEGSNIPQAVVDILRGVAARRAWSSTDQDNLREAYLPDKIHPRPKILETMLDFGSRADEFGELYLSALRNYQRVYFSEEENRICATLESALQRAKQLADELAFADLVEALSHGVRLGMEMDVEEWLLVPSFWISPLVFFERLGDKRGMLIFGSRPSGVALVPGDVIPEGILRTLKTLADPTRLKILRYLTHENMTPAELSRRLRLRAPTVTHHLNMMRLSGLVFLTLEEKNERHYTARLDAVEEMLEALKGFLVQSEEKD